ncbi:MAG: helix-hairpin-helix domain-containing protein [Actinomycetospora chiangmaiensis]|nr:helix-hairpin-helix domain-containing protein [Actinomycetospora chiangmaiensis]
MLSGPAILRISILLIIAGILAAVVQSLLPSPAPAPARMAESAAPVQPATPVPVPAPPPASEPVREATQAPAPASAQEPSTQEPAAKPRSVTAPAAPTQMPSDTLAFPSEPAAPPAAPGERQEAAQAEVDMAEDSAGPRALAVVDLNTASVADLNRLRGGGAIGRAIVSKRPYTSVDQLLTKRVLSRAVYERIRDQVTVR